MRLNNTFAALNNSIVNQKETNKSLNNLSSGLRINKASDDASGLAIADKLRTHASGIKQSIANANSAVALLQITDKAMDEISNILDIVKTKLIQAHTHTTSDNGRKAIKKDIEKLLSQIDNISNQTVYNDIKLLAHGGLDFHVGNTETDIVSVSDIYTSLDGLSGLKYKNNDNFDPSSVQLYGGNNPSPFNSSTPFTSSNLTFDPSGPSPTNYYNDILNNDIEILQERSKAIDINIQINTDNFQNIGVNPLVNEYTQITIEAGGAIFPQNNITTTYFDELTQIYPSSIIKRNDPIQGDYYYFQLTVGTPPIEFMTPTLTQKQTLNFKHVSTTTGITPTRFDMQNVIVNSIEPQLKNYTYNSGSQTFTVSDIIPPDDNEINITNSWYTDMSNLTQVDPNASGLCGSLNDLQSMSIDNFTFDCAGNFQEVVDYSLNLLNKYRSEAGSTQVQLESITRNLMTNYVNTKNAESVIRDVDYAQESSNFSKLNIIGQAGSFAQTKQNETQQRVLELLK